MPTPPAMHRTSSGGQVAKVAVGESRNPVEEATGSSVFQTRWLLAPFREASTSQGPVRSNCWTRGKTRKPISSDMSAIAIQRRRCLAEGCGARNARRETLHLPRTDAPTDGAQAAKPALSSAAPKNASAPAPGFHYPPRRPRVDVAAHGDDEPPPPKVPPHRPAEPCAGADRAAEREAALSARSCRADIYWPRSAMAPSSTLNFSMAQAFAAGRARSASTASVCKPTTVRRPSCSSTVCARCGAARNPA